MKEKNYCRITLEERYKIEALLQVQKKVSEMKEIRKKFNNMIGCSEPAKIQIIGRIGRASQSYISYRKPVSDKLI